MMIRHSKRVQRISSAPRPPDAVAHGTRSQAKPALTDSLPIDDFARVEIDQAQLMSIVPRRGSQHMMVVCQSDDVKRQVGERDLLAGRRERPAVGQKKALGAWPSIASSFLRRSSDFGDHDRANEQHSRHHELDGLHVVDHLKERV